MISGDMVRRVMRMTASAIKPGAPISGAHESKPEEYLNVHQVARRYLCTEETVYRHSRAGSLPFTKVAGKLLFSLRALEAHEARHSKPAA